MKTTTVALTAHYAQRTRTLARCLRFERRDGVVVTVTGASDDLVILGETYRSRGGVNPMAIGQQMDGAVQNSEVNGALSTDFASEAEIISGLWDGAFVTVFEVNYRDLTMGRLTLQAGTLGNVKAGRSAFTAELRGLLQALQQSVGRVFTPHCLATLGDDQCGVDVESMRFSSTLTGVTNRRVFTDSAATQVSDWFGAGVLRVESGEMDGAEMEVYGFAGGVYTLALPLPMNPEIGMAYSVLPGCRKRHERGGRNPLGVSDCKDKYDNVIRFRGMPPSMFPGNNRILGFGSTKS
ncbi:DUF2163 domain-containing protein [Variovorax paradoxus]|uniref:DUF2163 domain-containing protein n=1 Tax=Variovorax paradoxus TaxID=34073 RepID=UPI0006761C44